MMNASEPAQDTSQQINPNHYGSHILSRGTT